MEEPRRQGGRYELGAILGRGGMAEVHFAHDIRLNRSVAVKTLRADLALDPSFQARFRREAQSAASLNHPSICGVYDTGEDFVDGVLIPYIVMEHVEGSTLRDLLHSSRQLLPERAMEMTVGILQALEYSHRNGIVHRDIKPANVMLTRTGQVKVMDFGIARAMGDSGMTMTQTAAVIGTAQYLSPEQAKGETVDARSDLYSTGCLLYELFTVRPPFIGDSPIAVAYQHVREAPQPPSVFRPELHPEVDAIVLKALAKEPGYRYQSADEMRADIEAYLDGRPVAATAALGAVGYGYGGHTDSAATTALPTLQQPPQQSAYSGDGGRPGSAGFDAGYADPAPAGGRRVSRGALIGIGVAGLALIGIVVTTALSLDGNDQQPAADASGNGQYGTDTAEAQAKSLDALLQSSNSSRTSVIDAVAAIKQCSNLAGSATTLRTAASQRDDLVTKLSELTFDKLPNHGDLVAQLTAAWKASANADNHYADWADQTAGADGCHDGHAANDPDQGNAASEQATLAKKKAAALWNPIAQQYGLPQRQFTEL
ncbi:Stk1 family PASTA domain-containing Ser/Thr kinase [Streptomyces sp. CB01373]|uniref:Stk1 family PASTA domain-containing Ser/Thr kinase n=1 Tax=Streptomyces sp. CB01373 TaxID=2020325 RepID=UPI0026A37600|nr:Stk1 family PASTA domain-containing Ser/Thr kinase [Streptomyces sp. CB01373]